MAPLAKMGAFFCAFFLVVGCEGSVNALEQEGEKSAPIVVGGPCEYKGYKGKATIVSICKKESPSDYNGPTYDSYEVKFCFHTEEKIKEAFAQVEGREYILKLTNSWYPGPKFLDKYGIKEDKIFNCTLKVSTKGTCTPVVFDFPDIDLSDYFENQ